MTDDVDAGGLRLDHDRGVRTGTAEAVYAPGKSPAQCSAAVAGLLDGGCHQDPVLLTRADEQQVQAALARNPGGTITEVGVDPGSCRSIAIVTWRPLSDRSGQVVVLTAGTADLPVAHEAAAALAAYGYSPALVPDVGVAGVHRVLAERERLAAADVVIVVAGMEGALASVTAGLTAAPVIAVPTSTGYGAGFAGVTALLGMLASCSPGIVVVGIDNGFGAACAATRILKARRREVP